MTRAYPSINMDSRTPDALSQARLWLSKGVLDQYRFLPILCNILLVSLRTLRAGSAVLCLRTLF